MILLFRNNMRATNLFIFFVSTVGMSLPGLSGPRLPTKNRRNEIGAHAFVVILLQYNDFASPKNFYGMKWCPVEFGHRMTTRCGT